MSNRPPFNLDAPFVARHAFVFDGRQIEAGAPFDWQALGVPRYRVLNLWQCAYIDNERAPLAPGPEPSSPAQPQAETAARIKPTRAERRSSARS